MKLKLKHGFHLKIAISKYNASCFFLLFFLKQSVFELLSQMHYTK